ncbi:hypothetical protein E8E14_013134 [Neopestalotiopsis sp. 37M]|nr:hypothetical protein E8E14_013134 [Neopestalotiopsis sp. 37M]
MFRFKLFEITRAPPGMYTLYGMEYGYIDNRIYVFSLIMNIEGGIVIPRNYSHTGVQVAIPSQFVQCLDNLIRQPRWKPFRPEAPAARAKWALNKLIEERYDIDTTKISVGGYRVFFRDNKNGPLIRVAVGKFEVVQDVVPNNRRKNNWDKTPRTANTLEQQANITPKVKRVSWAPDTGP